MASAILGTVQATTVAGLFDIDFAAPLPGLADPHLVFSACQARGGAAGWMALQVDRGWPVRARALDALGDAAIPNVLLPVAHGPAQTPAGGTGYFVICPTPPGPAITVATRVWTEAELIENLLRPAAAVLQDLQRRRITHRAIRPANLFQARPNSPVTLGCAWAAPPASHQPPLFEPPYVASCLPAGRGDGSIADDVYALGVVMLILALGRDPTAGEPPETVIGRKLDLGSFAAIAGSHRLPTGIADLVRGMLADDPDHRPSPTLLCDPPAARARRLTVKAPRRSSRPLACGPVDAWNARTFAHAILRCPDQALAVLRTPAFDLWLRRSVGDAGNIGQVDDLIRIRAGARSTEGSQADAILLTGLAAVFDPLAPLVWRGLALWPDGIGAALNQALHAQTGTAVPLAEIVAADITPLWAARRTGRIDLAVVRLDARTNRQWLMMPQPAGGHLRLNYALNVLAPCDSPLLLNGWMVRVADLPTLLERVTGSGIAKSAPLDDHILAFIASRREDWIDADLHRLVQAAVSLDGLSQLALLARLQDRLRTDKLPRLANWLLALLHPAVERFASLSRRQRLSAQLAELADAGALTPMHALLTAEIESIDDRAGRNGAKQRLAAITLHLAALDSAETERGVDNARIGRDVGAGIGLLAMAAAAAAALFT